MQGGAEQGTGHKTQRWWWWWQWAELRNRSPSKSTRTGRCSSCAEKRRGKSVKIQRAPGLPLLWRQTRREGGCCSASWAGALGRDLLGAEAVCWFRDYVINMQDVREKKVGPLYCKDRTRAVEECTSHTGISTRGQASRTPHSPRPLLKRARVDHNFHTALLSCSFTVARDLPHVEKLGSKMHSHGFIAVSTCRELLLYFKIFRKINKACHNCW